MKRIILRPEILGALITLFILIGCASVHKRYEEAQTKNNTLTYENFLRLYPDSEYTSEVKIQLAKLYAQRNWKEAQLLDTISAYEQYLEKHSGSEYDKQAHLRLEQLNIMQDWKDAAAIDTITALESFLKKHPDSEYLVQASERLEQIGNEEIETFRQRVINASKISEKIIIPIFAYRETAEEPHFIFKASKGRYFKVTINGTKEYQNGLDVPYLRYAKPYEAVVLYISMHDAVDEKVHEIIGKLMKNLLKEFGIQMSEGKILFLSDVKISNERSTKGTRDVRQFILSYITNVESLSRLLNSVDSGNRKNAAIALGLTGDREAVVPLITAMNDNDLEVRMEAIKSLKLIKMDGALFEINQSAIDRLHQVLQDDNLDIRENAAEVLVQIGAPLPVHVIERLISDLKDGGNISHRISSARLLGKLKNTYAVTTLIMVLKDKDPQVRQTAVWALGEIKDARAVNPLITALSDNKLGSDAQDALVKIGQPAVDKLIKVMNDRDVYVSDRAEKALVWIGLPAVQPLINALKIKNNYSWKTHAISALGKIGDVRAIEPLINVFGDDVSYVEDTSDSVTVALRNIGPSAVDPLIKALNNKSIRVNVAWALDEIGGDKAQDALNRLLKCKNVSFSEMARNYKSYIKNGNGDKQVCLILALKRFGTKEMAEDFLNSGNWELGRAGWRWARRTGYLIIPKIKIY